jgi:hypothetical protein
MGLSVPWLFDAIEHRTEVDAIPDEVPDTRGPRKWFPVKARALRLQPEYADLASPIVMETSVR